MADAAEGKPAVGAIETIDRAFRDHQRLLWALAYRMTGVAADVMAPDKLTAIDFD